MDARLVLVLAALLVGASDATQVPQTSKLLPPPMRLDEKDLDSYHALSDLYKQYAHLAEMIEFSKESDCKQYKFEEAWEICAEFNEIERENCEQLAENFKDSNKKECTEDPHAVLSASIGKNHVRRIRDFEAGLEGYIVRKELRNFPRFVSVRMFALRSNRLGQFEELKESCRLYLHNYEEALSYFEESRKETLKLLRHNSRNGYGRELEHAMEDCKYLSD
jgi:hypothetical protein